MNLNLHQERYNYRDLMIFVIPLIVFSLYLYIYNPGILTVESFSQLHQIATGQFSNAHPILHTIVEMIFLKIYGSPLIIGIVQILVFSIMWTLICKYHRDDSAGNSNHFVLQAIVTLIISAIPLNGINSITLSNYVLFSYFLMFLCFLIKVMIDKNGEIDNKFIVIMAVTMALVAGFNNYGPYIALISLIFITAYLYKKNVSQNTYILLAGLTIVLILSITALGFATVGDDTWNIQSDDGGINIEAAKTQFFSSINDTPKEGFEDVTAANLGNEKYNSIDSFVNTFKDNEILNLIFNNPIIYMMLTILLFLFIQTIKKLDNSYIIYLPALINTIIAFITSPAQFNLSLYANQLVFYVGAIILISIWINENSIEISAPQTPKKQEYNQDNYSIGNEIYSKNDETYEKFESKINQPILKENTDMSSEINIEKETMNPPKAKTEPKESEEEFSSDLLDEILKEIEK